MTNFQKINDKVFRIDQGANPLFYAYQTATLKTSDDFSPQELQDFNSIDHQGYPHVPDLGNLYLYGGLAITLSGADTAPMPDAVLFTIKRIVAHNLAHPPQHYVVSPNNFQITFLSQKATAATSVELRKLIKFFVLISGLTKVRYTLITDGSILVEDNSESLKEFEHVRIQIKVASLDSFRSAVDALPTLCPATLELKLEASYSPDQFLTDLEEMKSYVADKKFEVYLALDSKKSCGADGRVLNFRADGIVGTCTCLGETPSCGVVRGTEVDISAEAYGKLNLLRNEPAKCLDCIALAWCRGLMCFQERDSASDTYCEVRRRLFVKRLVKESL
jgi:radical SAM protein with 4Fe4S-binding SPASM domain